MTLFTFCPPNSTIRPRPMCADFDFLVFAHIYVYICMWYVPYCPAWKRSYIIIWWYRYAMRHSNKHTHYSKRMVMVGQRAAFAFFFARFLVCIPNIFIAYIKLIYNTLYVYISVIEHDTHIITFISVSVSVSICILFTLTNVQCP